MKDQETNGEAERQPLLSHLFPKSSIAADSIIATRSMNDSQTLVSLGQKFELGFFSAGGSGDLYLVRNMVQQYPN